MSDSATAGYPSGFTPAPRPRLRHLTTGAWYLSLYLLVILGLILVNALVVFDAGTQNHQAVQNEKRTLAAILNARLKGLGSDAAVNAVWTEAFENLVVHFDRKWMTTNYNDSFYKSFKADRLLLVDGDDTAMHFLYGGVPGSADLAQETLADPEIRRLIARARGMKPDPATAADGFAIINGQLNLVGASRIAPNGPPSTTTAATPGVVFLLTTIVDAPFLASIPPDFGFHGLQILAESNASPAASDAGILRNGWLGLREPATLSIGPEGAAHPITLGWQPQRPGNRFMQIVLPPVLLVSLIVAAFGVIVIRRLQSNTKQLTAAYIEAAAGSETKTRFLAMMNHELRTPLNSVIGFADLMAAELFGPLGNAKYREYLSHIGGSGRHLLGIINDVLDLAALTKGGLKLDEAHFVLSTTLDDVVARLTPAAAAAGVLLSLNLHHRREYFFGDAKRIAQMTENLLSNAIKFTPEGGHARISSWLDENGRPVLSVSDTGIGLPSSAVPRALEFFGQIDGALARRYEGIGLGLPVAKSLAELHGGALTITGKVGVGTTVTLTFPASRMKQPERISQIAMV